MKIKSIRQGSVAEILKILPGSKLIEINGVKIRDSLDYKYHSAEPFLEILIESPRGDMQIFEIERDSEDDIGLEFVEDKTRCCANKCIFCFIDQLPAGLRKSLYIKDEDYRLSFIDGNFITLTSVTEKDLERIVKYHLSPLYVSVHTTNEKLREVMLGRKNLRPVMETLSRLTSAEIEIHTQIVLCPGYNDGRELDKTIDNLNSLRPNLKSVGIVPVGLSDHRTGLTDIISVDRTKALEIVDTFGTDAQKIYRNDDEGFVYLADEFFLLAGAKIPETTYYDDFVQYENGIGMVRSFLNDFLNRKQLLREIGGKKLLNLLIITGKLMEPAFNNEIIPVIRQMKRNLNIEVLGVENHLLGKSITVSGLLCGNDIIEDFNRSNLHPDIVILPSNCLNSDGYLLDDYTPNSISESIKTRVAVGSYDVVGDIMAVMNGVN